jgi:hypothetical protein
MQLTGEANSHPAGMPCALLGKPVARTADTLTDTAPAAQGHTRFYAAGGADRERPPWWRVISPRQSWVLLARGRQPRARAPSPSPRPAAARNASPTSRHPPPTAASPASRRAQPRGHLPQNSPPRQPPPSQTPGPAARRQRHHYRRYPPPGIPTRPARGLRLVPHALLSRCPTRRPGAKAQQDSDLGGGMTAGTGRDEAGQAGCCGAQSKHPN